MQPLIAAPRDGFTADEVRALLTGDSVTVTPGLELLDTSNVVVEDITTELARGGSVSWDNRDAIHASVRLSITRALTWGKDRVRPYMVLSDGETEARFNLGVYVPTTPDTTRGENPVTYSVTGYDLLSLLQATGPGDTFTVTSGTTYFAALQTILTDSGIGAALLIDGTRQDTTLPATRVWALTSPPQSWLRIMTDLLAEIGYVAPWMDWDGAIRSQPYQSLEDRPVEWTLDLSDAATNLVSEDRTLSIETGDVANWWRFVRKNMDATPVEGDGIYTVENQGTGPTSQLELGRVVRRVEWLEAADQDALVAQGDKIVAGDMAAVTKYELTIDPLPAMWHADVFRLIDSDEDGAWNDNVKVEAVSWELSLDGDTGSLQLGGNPPEPLEAFEGSAKATVTSAAPLRVVVDGATVDSFANALDGGSYSIGQRVTVKVRNPLPPLVEGVES